MSRLLFACYQALALLLLLLVFQTSNCKDTDLCPPSSCGILNISYPFILANDLFKKCGSVFYSLHCEKNISTVLYLDSRKKYYVQAINYNKLTIRLVDAGVRKNDCSSLPNFSITSNSLDSFNSYTWFQYKRAGLKWFPKHKFLPLSQKMIFMNCANPVNSPLYVDTGTCLDGEKSSNISPLIHSYVNIGGMNASDMMELCSLERITLFPAKDYKNMSFKEIHSQLAYGFELSWHNSRCGGCADGCSIDDSNSAYCIGSSWFEITFAITRTVLLLLIAFIGKDSP